MKRLLILIFVATAFLSFGQVPSYVPTNGLVGWWPFNGNANDESGNGNNGTVNGPVSTTDRFGNPNSAYDFDGVNDWIEVTHNSNINFNITDEYSISFWTMKSSSNFIVGQAGDIICKWDNGYVQYPYKNGSSTSATGYSLLSSRYSGGTPQNNLNVQSIVSSELQFDVFNHTVVTFLPSGGIKLFINGVYEGTSNLDNLSSVSSTFNLFFGRRGVSTSRFFNGKIDDIGIWNRALTECEIRELYTSGAPSVAVFNDLNQNCIQESELGVEGVNVLITPGNYIATTGSSGIASFPSLSDGTYTATIDTTNLNWSPTCGTSQTFSVTNGQANCIVFGLANNNPCTDPDVSIYAPYLRRCSSHTLPIYVSACNNLSATGVLDSAYVQVVLDEDIFDVIDATVPMTQIGVDTFEVYLGNLNPGECSNFRINAFITCEPELGETVCMEATLFPAEACIFDSIPSDPVTNDGIGGTLDGLPQPCTLPWDQSSLSVEGWCTGDSVYFSITNTGELGGGDMECYSPVWLTVDGVVTDTDSLMIQGGETVIYAYPASGQTFFLNAEQHPLHPGNSHPNAHVELCGDSTNWTPGIVNQFPQDDADPDVDIYCGQIVGSYDPNDKTGYPLGQTEAHYVQPNQQLQYVVRFQNTGTDTAFTVVVRDTLDLDLNIFTVTPGVASHPYTFRMYGPRVLEWTFENINLPDSTTNLDESNGFLTFHVDQVPNLAPGTVINNSVDIYFDFELPITTNTTEHVIYEGFVSVLSVEDLTEEGKDILVYPNPTTNLITIQSENVLNNSFKIFDQNGREVLNGKLNGKSTEVSLSKLSKGMYTLQVDGNYKSAVIIKQ